MARVPRSFFPARTLNLARDLESKLLKRHSVSKKARSGRGGDLLTAFALLPR